MTYVEIAKPLSIADVSYYTLDGMISDAIAWVQLRVEVLNTQVQALINNPYWRLAVDLATLGSALGGAAYALAKILS